MPAGPVIANNTPLVALWVLDRLELLRDLYGEVLIPPAVRDEFTAVETTLRRASLQQAPWIRTAALEKPQRARVFTDLDQGEAEVLALAEERSARLVIIDERKGRRFAKRLGLPLTGTMGLLLLAKEEGMVPKISPLIDEILAAGLYLDQTLVDQVTRMARE
jgi:predicted nucleic acid-binding protein